MTNAERAAARRVLAPLAGMHASLWEEQRERTNALDTAANSLQEDLAFALLHILHHGQTRTTFTMHFFGSRHRPSEFFSRFHETNSWPSAEHTPIVAVRLANVCSEVIASCRACDLFRHEREATMRHTRRCNPALCQPCRVARLALLFSYVSN